MTDPALASLALFGGPQALPGGPRLRPRFGPELAGELAELLATRPLSTLFGEHDVAELERLVAARLGVAGAVAVNAGTSSLHAALIALGIGPGDEVPVTCFSFVATASVIAQVGATPVWVDIDETTLGLDNADLERKIGPRTKAVMVAHLFGIPNDVAATARLCKAKGIPLIEDACQALGATVGGRAIGAIGTVGCFSFNVNKIVQTGEGGMLVSDDAAVLDVARELRVNGLSPFGVERLGMNYTMTNVQARIGCHQMARLDEILARRRRFGEMIAAALAPHAHVFPETRTDVARSCYAVPFRVPVATRAGRDLLVAALSREGVPVSGVYEILYKHEAVFGPRRGPECPVAERVIPGLLSINPSHHYEEDDVARFCEGAAKVLARAEVIERVALEDERVAAKGDGEVHDAAG